MANKSHRSEALKALHLALAQAEAQIHNWTNDAITAWAAAAEKAKEAADCRDELQLARVIAFNARADACEAHPDFSRLECSIEGSTRAVLIKALTNLASPVPAIRADAGLMAEQIRSKLGLTWNQLLVQEADDDLADEHDDELDLDNDEDLSF